MGVLLDSFVRLLSIQIVARRSLPPRRKKSAMETVVAVHAVPCRLALVLGKQQVNRQCTHEIRSWIRPYIWHWDEISIVWRSSAQHVSIMFPFSWHVDRRQFSRFASPHGSSKITAALIATALDSLEYPPHLFQAQQTILGNRPFTRNGIFVAPIS
jgi:hypothetical protein